MTRRFWAFTLAETLIVMGIIGVVAALTVPNLNASTGEKEKVAKVKKIYKDLVDAHTRAIAVYGPVEEWFINDSNNKTYSKRYAERILDFLKISKNCGSDKNTIEKSCMSDGGGVSLSGNEYSVLTPDGSSILFDVSHKNCDLGSSSNPEVVDSPIKSTCGYIKIDIDGVNGKNDGGVDRFAFYITTGGIYPWGCWCDVDRTDPSNWGGSLVMTDWVIQNGNMDYLKANSSGKCPNGVQLSFDGGNTSCK